MLKGFYEREETMESATTVTHWAWPRQGGTLQSNNWRDKLYNSLALRLGREPMFTDLQYTTEHNETDHSYCTTVTVTVDGTEYEFTGVPQDTNTAAIRCVAWVALMELCTAKILEHAL